MNVKKFLPLSLLSALLLLAAGCQKTPALTAIDHGGLDGLDGVSAVLEQESYSRDVAEISGMLHNDSACGLVFGVDYTLEYLDGDTWKQVAFAEEMCWIEIAYELMPGGTFDLTFPLGAAFQNLPAGSYRFVKSFWYSEDGGESTPALLLVPFTLR